MELEISWWGVLEARQERCARHAEVLAKLHERNVGRLSGFEPPPLSVDPRDRNLEKVGGLLRCEKFRKVGDTTRGWRGLGKPRHRDRRRHVTELVDKLEPAQGEPRSEERA
jgi:hypothetical protein